MADINNNQGSREGRQGTSNRGFASMSETKQREIASKGGHAAHAQGTAHEWTSEEAREAGRKGGQASHGGGRGHVASRRQQEQADRGASSQGYSSMDKDEKKQGYEGTDS